MSKIIPLLEKIFQEKGGSGQLWKATNEALLQKTEEAKKFCVFMKTKLRDINQETQLLALDFLDYQIDDGKLPLWTQVGSRDFLSSMVNILKTRDSPEVQNKILFLIEKWNRKFEKYNTIIPFYGEVYKQLKNSGVVFPQDQQSTYSKYVMTEQDLNEYNSNLSNAYSQERGKTYEEMYNIDLQENSYDKKYRRLIKKLNDWSEGIIKANELMDLNDRGSYDEEKLNDIISDLKLGRTQLKDTIESGKLKDSKLMEISLAIWDDINQTISRAYNIDMGKKDTQFKSVFAQKMTIKKQQKNENFSEGNNQQQGIDLFGNFQQGQMGQSQNQMQQSGKQGKSVNDLFDVFSGGQPGNSDVNSNTNTNNNMDMFFNPQPANMNSGNNNNNMNMFSNMQGGNNNKNFGGFGLNLNMNTNSKNQDSNIMNLVNPQQNKPNTDFLAQQVQMAYGNSNDNIFNMNNMNSGNSQFNMNANKNPNTNENPTQSANANTLNLNQPNQNSNFDFNFLMSNPPSNQQNQSGLNNNAPSSSNMNMNFNQKPNQPSNFQNTNANLNFQSQSNNNNFNFSFPSSNQQQPQNQNSMNQLGSFF